MLLDKNGFEMGKAEIHEDRGPGVSPDIDPKLVDIPVWTATSYDVLAGEVNGLDVVFLRLDLMDPDLGTRGSQIVLLSSEDGKIIGKALNGLSATIRPLAKQLAARGLSLEEGSL